MAENNLEVDGFVFSSRKDAAVAENELKGVEYLKNKTDMNNAIGVLATYNKIVSEGLFHTPVGMSYVRELQQYLIDSPVIDNKSIMDIPVEPLHAGIASKNLVDKVANVFSNSRKAYRDRLKLAVFTNIILVITIIMMFIISITTNNINILNYKEKLENRYAAWEQDLTEREKALDEK